MMEPHEIIAHTWGVKWRVVRYMDVSWWYEGFNDTLGYITDSPCFSPRITPSYEHFRAWLISEIRREQ